MNVFYAKIAGIFLLAFSLLSCTEGLDNGKGGDVPGGGDGQEKDVPYIRKSLFMDFTSTGCLNCPRMATSLDAVMKECPGEIAAVAMHCHYSGIADPMYLQFTDTYMKKFDITALPSGMFNLNGKELTDIKSEIEDALDKEMAVRPGCGVAIESSFDSATRKASVTAKITSNVQRIYRCLIILIENGLEYPQAGVEEEGYVHNHVARALMGNNIFGERMNNAQPLVPGQEYTATRTKELPEGFDAGRMSVIVAAMVSDDNGVTWTCDNVSECPLGADADYRIEESQ